jgi:hypothetical protein
MKNDVSKAMRGANSKTGLAGVYSRASAESAAYSGFKANRGVMPRGFERERYGDPAHVAAAVDILKHKQAYDLDAISSASLTSKGGRGGSYGYDALPYKNRAAGFKLTGRNSIYDKFIGRL